VADFGTKVIFPRAAVPDEREDMTAAPRSVVVGDYVKVKVTAATPEVLKGEAVTVTRLQTAT
jgi:hypothetical protein